MNNKTPSPLSLLISKNFPAGTKFPKAVLKWAGNTLKNKDESSALAVLKKGYDPDFSRRDFLPTAKCPIVDSNKPIDQFLIYKTNLKIQEIFYKSKKHTERDEPSLSFKNDKESYKQLCVNNGLIWEEIFNNSQALGKILTNASNIYKGIFTKINNKYEKQLKRVNRINVERQKNNQALLPLPDKQSAVDDQGYLLNPPGPNPVFYGYQQCNLRNLENDNIISELKKYKNYHRKVSDVINCNYSSEIALKSVPEWQKPKLSAKKSKRRKVLNKNNPILLSIKFGEDWIVFDGRGLLRDVYWRKLAKPGTLTIEQLLDFFTKDPVIDPIRNSVSLSYNETALQTLTKKVSGFKKSPDYLKKVLSTQPIINSLTIDLGATHPISYNIHNLYMQGDEVKANLDYSEFLTAEQIDSLNKVKISTDQLEQDILNQAVLECSPEEQEEISKFNAVKSEKSKELLCDKYCFNVNDINWDSMSSKSTIIYDYLCNKGVNFENNGDKIYDSRFAKDLKFKLSPETRNKLNNFIWELKKKSDKYKKISVRKKELSRSIINKLISDNDVSLVVIEDLNMKGGFFDGNGKKEVKGWSDFFQPRKENRWFMKSFHKCLSDLAQNKGISVIEVNPKFTSVTCTECEHASPENRNGEKFECKKCGYIAHADREIACHNILKVALTGKSMKGYEALSSTKVKKTARKK